MNSNLRSMIEDALDGELHDETFSYDSYEDVPSAYGGDEITKLASALNFVATSLDDLGTTDEKLAELELLQEKIASGSGATATAEAAEDTLGAFYKNLKGGSRVGLSDAFGKLSTGRKFAVGGGAGLVGLGALYGGAKMLGGGDKQTNVVKVSSLQDAKQRALVKMAEHYNIPVWELEKIALDTPQGLAVDGLANKGALSEVARPGKGATKAELTTYKKYQQQLAQRRRTADMLLGNKQGISDATKTSLDNYAKGQAVTAAEASSIRENIAANPTSSQAFQSGDRVLGQRQSPDAYGTMRDRVTRNRQGAVVRGNYVERTLSDGSKVNVEARYAGMPVEKLEARLQGPVGGKSQIKSVTLSEGDALAKERLGLSRDSNLQQRVKRDAIAKQRAANQATTASKAGRNADGSFISPDAEKRFSADQVKGRDGLKAKRGAQMERAAVRNQLLGPQSRSESEALRDTLKSGVDKILAAQSNKAKPTLTPNEVAALKSRLGDNYMLAVNNAGNRGTEQAAASARQTRNRSGVKGSRQANVDSAATQGRRTGGLGSKAATEAGEKELGFLAKNRRALLGAGALGAAGLAGYGAYKAFGGGGQSKAASYRGMRKLAEDRISPARIRARKADPFSGMDIHRPGMSRSASPYEPIGIKAQRIRDQINSDMRGYVSNVGGGYNLDRYLNKFNK